jgi:ATP-dependent DNA ligase
LRYFRLQGGVTSDTFCWLSPPADTHLVIPKLVGEINYAWEPGAVLRQTSFEALREDKTARQVLRDR